MDKKNLIVIVGPTAVGKTDLSIYLAKQLKTEVISADSRQFYIEMNIGTAKPTSDELAQVPHHFINNRKVDNYLNAGVFEIEALELINQLFEKYNELILVGGSGLYIDALLYGLDDMPLADLKLREELTEKANNGRFEELQIQLQLLDPEYYEQMDKSNKQRVVRALEVCIASGMPYSKLRLLSKKERKFSSIAIGLEMERTVLFDRINKRVDLMVQSGLFDEVKKLIQYRNTYPLQTVGYKEVFQYFDEELSLEEAIEQIKKNSRNYAKRQETWFKKDKNTTWFKPENRKEILSFVLNKLKKN
ncbi:MAG: tRNA (adenosine(37)-N6)-dimethylallyltransferase MiaA [Bacteroidota bacterium]|nr:tRNA (adenosine(37)-N6)-dimethylallyltransferase MiaA [Bacteroidota bacterium]